MPASKPPSDPPKHTLRHSTNQHFFSNIEVLSDSRIACCTPYYFLCIWLISYRLYHLIVILAFLSSARLPAHQTLQLLLKSLLYLNRSRFPGKESAKAFSFQDTCCVYKHQCRNHSAAVPSSAAYFAQIIELYYYRLLVTQVFFHCDVFYFVCIKGISKNLPFPLFCRRPRIFRGRGIKGEVK